mmetsp:Transcript_20423/g.82437  ORF Transcript_20423/g.82437 Transcript_20423/m.82437 type:complete len:91 (-) Transcript_20423:3377-3649(-)
MGFYLLHESMLDSVVLSRDKFLKPGGIMVPSQAKIFLSLVSVPNLYHERVSFWDNVCGYDMSSVFTHSDSFMQEGSHVLIPLRTFSGRPF